MNFIFVSPNFPHTYWNWCDRLHKSGVNVLGIGDAAYDSLEAPLKNALTEYYKVSSLENYDEVFRAVAYFSFKYGKIDWIESQNEYWLEQDARLRTDFNINTGIKADEVECIKRKSLMKQIYLDNGIPTARQHRVTDLAAGRKFLEEVGYPVIAKPDVGVGAEDTWKLENDADLEKFYAHKPAVPYVMEEFMEGDIVSYEAILDSRRQPLFENMTCWPPSIMDIVLKGLDLMYYTCPDMPEKFRALGRKTVQAFPDARRFVHLEFFKLKKARKGLGGVGDYAALEVNMRPPGGYTPDMINFAHSVDVYQIYADMVTHDKRLFPKSDDVYYCAYAGRRDGVQYVHTHAEIMDRYGKNMVMQEEMPPLNWPQMGRWMYTVRLRTEKEVQDFIRFVQTRA